MRAASKRWAKSALRGGGSTLGKGRPDFILWISLGLRVLGTDLQVQFPILLEEEGTGIDAAIEDYTIFLAQEGLSVPMIVLGGNRRDTRIKRSRAKVAVEITQIPFSYIFPE